jgi:DNA-binding Lrp family transcriptional regulator
MSEFKPAVKIVNVVVTVSARVREAFMLYGTYDAVAVIEADSMENLNQIYKMITRIEGVQSATTMIAIEGKS